MNFQTIRELCKKQAIILTVIGIWLFTLTIFVVCSQISISNSINEQTQETAQDSANRALQANILAELAQKQKQLEQQNLQVDQKNKDNLTKIQQLFLEQLRLLEEKQQAQIASEPVDINELKEQLLQLKEQFNKLKPTTEPVETPQAQPVNRTGTNKPAAAPTIPFKILGVELRASEQFLVIVPSKTPSLSHVKLLRVGDKDGNWQLQSIEGNKAIFKVNGVTRKLSIPK
ncbi:hypothetical protein [Zophobihabitans entericus]|uniref:Uncharacterized protein n=1 Tax=Zophobihabitans entericus TaxID=1635327 RepID=A0A6G9IEB9_9GAMM|nr:hypothetical protein [Zophobihabitans entericus]QIQ22159.1 hypothetical protein IPMB12_10965 [Zophobihabitans entericus]